MIRIKFVLMVIVGAALIACSGAEDQPAATTPSTSNTAALVAAPVEHPGAEVYQNYCFSCHTPGLNGAPVLGDVDAWGARIAKGQALLLQATIEGIQPAMPPRGMCFSCSDDELAAAVDYMIAESQ